MIDNITQKNDDRHLANLVDQAKNPSSRIARQLKRYQAADHVAVPPTLNTFFTDLGSILASIEIQIRHGIHPEAIIEAQKKATTPPGRG